jgi:ubiquinone/menaquinone biosynthesis C-methylase UbiE
MVEASKTQVNFDCLARLYRALEYAVFDRALEEARHAFLEALPRAGRVLLLGDGDGRYLKRAVDARPEVRFVSLDSSRAMLAVARRRLAADKCRQVEFVHAAAEEWLVGKVGRRDQRFDAVVTHFFLDCFTDRNLEELVTRIASLLRPGGNWVVSEFSVPAGCGGDGSSRRVLLAIMYLFFRVTTGLRARVLPDYAKALRCAGFARHACRKSVAWEGFVVSELWRASL